MKWIGQHIWDFISRFRSTVYIENLETSSEENVLVVDSDGKVTKNTTLGGSDLTLTNAGDNRVITSTGGTGLNAEANITYDTDGLYLTSALSSSPILRLLNSNTNATAPDFQFQKTADGAVDDELGQIRFIGDDDGGGVHNYVSFNSYIANATAGDEAGRLAITVAASNSTTSNSRQAFTAIGHGTNDIVDIGLGYGTASTTNVAGALSANTWGFLGGTANALITDDGDGTVTSEANFTYSGTAMSIDAFTSTFTNSTSSSVYIKNTGDNAAGGNLYFVNERSAGVDSDVAGHIYFQANDDGGSLSTVVEIEGKLGESAHGSERGEFSVDMLTASGGILRNVINGVSNAGDVVNVNLGFGDTSTINIAGTLTVGQVGSTTLAMNNSGLLTVAAQTNITSLGTLTNLQVDDVNIKTKSIQILGDTCHTFTITTGAAGATTMTTVDAGGAEGHLQIQPDGILKLTPIGGILRQFRITAGSSAGEYDGDVVFTGSTTSMTAGDLYYYNSSGTWTKANASAEASTKGLLAIALGAESDTHGMLLRGMVTTGTIAGTQDEGAILYMRTSDGLSLIHI